MHILTQEEVDALLGRACRGRTDSGSDVIPGCAKKYLLCYLDSHQKNTCPNCNDCFRVIMDGEVVLRMPRTRKRERVLQVYEEVVLRDDQTFEDAEAEVRRVFPDAHIRRDTRRSSTEYLL